MTACYEIYLSLSWDIIPLAQWRDWLIHRIREPTMPSLASNEKFSAFPVYKMSMTLISKCRGPTSVKSARKIKQYCWNAKHFPLKIRKLQWTSLNRICNAVIFNQLFSLIRNFLRKFASNKKTTPKSLHYVSGHALVLFHLIHGHRDSYSLDFWQVPNY